MNKKPNYIHISFDLWQTLIKSNPQYKFKRTELLSQVFGVPIDYDESRKAKEKADWMMEASGVQIPYCHLIAMMLGDKYKAIPRERFITLLEEFDRLNHDLVLKYCPQLISDDVIPLLEKLRQNRISMSVLSNTSVIKGDTMTAVLEELQIGHYFNFMLFSDELGYAKPHRFAFQQVKNKAFNAVFHTTDSISSSYPILHVGDNPIADKAKGFDYAIITKEEPLTNLYNLLTLY